MIKLSAKRVSKCLNTDKKYARTLPSQAILDRFRSVPVEFFRLITMDRTWIHIYDPQNKEPKEWRQSGSPRPKKFKTQKSSNKGLVSVFWNNDGKECNHQSKVLRCISCQTEATTRLQTSRHASESNLVSSWQCCSSQEGHYAPKIDRSSLRNSETPGLHTWFGPFRLLSFLTSRNTSREESFVALRRPHQLRTGGSQHNQKNFSWMN
jgi:hypothetical protein